MGCLYCILTFKKMKNAVIESYRNRVADSMDIGPNPQRILGQSLEQENALHGGRQCVCAESHSKPAGQREAAKLREQLPIFMHVTNNSVMHGSGTPFSKEHEYKSPLQYQSTQMFYVLVQISNFQGERNSTFRACLFLRKCHHTQLHTSSDAAVTAHREGWSCSAGHLMGRGQSDLG